MNPLIINARGEKEPFSLNKVYQSARRVGASKALAQEIAKTLQKEVYPGIKTKKIFKRVKSMLHQTTPRAALRFNLKEGMRKLGPTGFPFEKYIGEILISKGFEVKYNRHLAGRCVTYEIDFLAKKGKFLYIGECKYRRRSGERVDLQVSLANYARFLDLKEALGKKSKDLTIEGLLVTNTKFTSQALRYCSCVGIELLGWNWPKGDGLEDLIDSEKLYPITILPSFKGHLIDVFSAKKMMLVKDLLEDSPGKIARRLNLSKGHIDPLIKEAKILLE